MGNDNKNTKIMFAHSARRIAKSSCRKIIQQQQKRSMGGGPKPTWTGIDAQVRAVFPEDWQLAGAILGGYTTLYILSTLWPSSKKKEEPAKVVAMVTAAVTTGIPDVNSPEFEKYVETDAFLNMLNNDEELSAWAADK